MSIDEKDSIIKFLDRCVEYANDSIERKRERGENEIEIKSLKLLLNINAISPPPKKNE